MQGKENALVKTYDELSSAADKLSRKDRKLALKMITTTFLPKNEKEGFDFLTIALEHAATVLAMSAAYHIIDHDGKHCAEEKIAGAEKFLREMTMIELADILKKANKPNPFEEKTHNQKVFEEILAEMEEGKRNDKE